MSIETWKLQFYPKPAEGAAPEEALEHSLLKWQGLRAANLAQHEVQRKGYQRCIGDETFEFRVNSETCALCHHHPSQSCKGCPLEAVRGVPCDKSPLGADRSPWGLWLHRNDPEPMIALIEAAIRGEVHDGQ